MKKRHLTTALALLPMAFCLLALRQTAPPAWGFFGHRKINRLAVFTLPPEMLVFYKPNLDWLTEHAVDADSRRYASRHEAPRHFLDLDRYGTPPFENLPRNWSDALMQHFQYRYVTVRGDTLPFLAKAIFEKDSLVMLNPRLPFGKAGVDRRQFRRFFNQHVLQLYYEDEPWRIPCDTLAALLGEALPGCHELLVVDTFSQHGVLPYNLEQMMRRLTEAFKMRDVERILRHSADIGHYIADAHVPLHTTANYNGQLTGQDGLHAFWETRLPEMFAEREYDFWVGQAELVVDPQAFFWGIVLESNALVDSVLDIERGLRQTFPPDRQLCNEYRNNVWVRTQCPEFAQAYHERMNGMVESRMQSAIKSVGSAWYTAWVLAGQPDLRGLSNPDFAKPDSTDLELQKAVNGGRQLGRPHE